MSASWKKLAARIDALTLRERAILFLSVIAVLAALVDTLWGAPARLRYRQVTQGFAQQSVELQRLREQVRANAAQPDAARAARQELEQLNSASAAADREIVALASSPKGVMTLSEVLVHILRRQPHLNLVRTSNLGVEAAGTAPVADARPLAPGANAWARQGLELTVAGPYAELVRYLQALESAMPDLRWGTLKLVAEKQPPELTLQVYVLRPQP